jgi:hypothetical protein
MIDRLIEAGVLTVAVLKPGELETAVKKLAAEIDAELLRLYPHPSLSQRIPHEHDPHS